MTEIGDAEQFRAAIRSQPGKRIARLHQPRNRDRSSMSVAISRVRAISRSWSSPMPGNSRFSEAARICALVSFNWSALSFFLEPVHGVQGIQVGLLGGQEIAVVKRGEHLVLVYDTAAGDGPGLKYPAIDGDRDPIDTSFVGSYPPNTRNE